MTRSGSNKLQKKRVSSAYDSPNVDTHSGRRDVSNPKNGTPATAKSVYHTPPQYTTSPVDGKGLGIKGPPVEQQSSSGSRISSTASTFRMSFTDTTAKNVDMQRINLPASGDPYQP